MCIVCVCACHVYCGGFLCVYTNVCVCTHTHVCVCKCGGQRSMLLIFLVHSPPCILSQAFSLESESMDFNRLPAPGCLSLPYTGLTRGPCGSLTSMQGPGICIPIIMRAGKRFTLSTIPHPPYDHGNGPEIDHLN